MALQVIEYLKTNSLQKLVEEFDIVVNSHKCLPIHILNYDQIKSPKKHPITMDCRGLVIDNNFNIIARSFKRFFNYGEFPEQDAIFDWGGVTVKSKEDGSLILLYFYEGQWRVNTRGSFGDGQLPYLTDKSWENLVNEIIGDGYEELNKDFTYVCELCSLNNRVVRPYEIPKLYFLASFHKEYEVVYDIKHSFFSYPNEYMLNSICAVHDWLEANAVLDPTFEGFVLKDKQGLMMKVKSKSYYNLHRIKNNDQFKIEFIIETLIKNETGELYAYFPECQKIFAPISSFVDDAIDQIYDVWHKNHHKESQKDFAAGVKHNQFAPYLFLLRKNGAGNATKETIRSMIADSVGTMVKVYKTTQGD